MAGIINQNTIMKALDWGYEKALDGGGVFDTAYDLANDFQKKHNSIDDAVKSLIKWQTTKCATSGFLSGIGGLITLPVAIPANISSVVYIQLRMIAAIAIMGGYDPKSDQVKSLAYVCLTGGSAAMILKGIGIRLGEKISEKLIQKISTEVLVKINQKVGFRLLTKFGQTGIVNLGKAIPFLGGIIGGTIDASYTITVGKVAKKTFIV